MIGIIGLLAVLRAEEEIRLEEDVVTILCPNSVAHTVMVNIRNVNAATRSYVRQNAQLN